MKLLKPESCSLGVRWRECQNTNCARRNLGRLIFGQEFDYVPGEWEVRARGADVGGKLVVIGSKLNEKAIAELFGC